MRVVKKAPVYTNYKKGKKTHKYLKKGSVKKVKAIATDTKKKVWIKVGSKKWIASKHTVVITTTARSKAKSSSSTSAITKAANQVAKTQVGKAYVWGATGPSSFDCSGLVQWVYKNAVGKTVSRTTYTQVNEAVKVTVSTSRLQRGDLLFWGTSPLPTSSRASS